MYLCIPMYTYNLVYNDILHAYAGAHSGIGGNRGAECRWVRESEARGPSQTWTGHEPSQRVANKTKLQT